MSPWWCWGNPVGGDQSWLLLAFPMNLSTRKHRIFFNADLFSQVRGCVHFSATYANGIWTEFWREMNGAHKEVRAF